MEGEGIKAGHQLWPKLKKACQFHDSVRHQNIWLPSGRDGQEVPGREPEMTGRGEAPPGHQPTHQKLNAATRVTTNKTSK